MTDQDPKGPEPGDAADDETVEDDRSDGERSDGERSDGERSDGERSDGERSDGERSDGERSDGERSDGERSDGERSDGERSDGERSDGERSDGEPAATPSLGDVHSSVSVPDNPSFWRRLFAFSGPAYLVSVGYMDPGNWATDIAAGARFGSALLWVLLMSNLMAVVLQSMAARVGVVSGLDLAQACRAMYGRRTSFVLWLLAELAIAATDLAEVLGSAIGLQLLFGLPLMAGVLLTVLDTFVLLALNRMGMRLMEAFILVLIGTIGACLGLEVVFSQPQWGSIAAGLVPSLPGEGALYLAVGMLGATVMPHNLYLHSALVQSRRIRHTHAGIRAGLRFNLIDSVVALNAAFFVNAALLVMAAATFFTTGHHDVGEIQQAHRLLEPLLGVRLAPLAFAIALIASGQSSTITGTLAGQIVMEGFVHLRLRPIVRRLATRAVALLPAIFTFILFGEQATGKLLVLSQVILSLQLSFAVVPLLHVVSDERFMTVHAARPTTRLVGWLIAAVIIVLNLQLAYQEVRGWAVGPHARLVSMTAVPVAVGLFALLVYVIAMPLWQRRRADAMPSPHLGVHGAPEMPELEPAPAPQRICAAVDFSSADQVVLAHALTLARAAGRHANIHLLHIVESAGARALGDELHDSEVRSDRAQLELYTNELIAMGVHASFELGFGEPVDALAALIDKHGPDLVVLGGHGHRLLGDLVHGTTVDRLRHRISAPLLVVPAGAGKAGD